MELNDLTFFESDFTDEEILDFDKEEFFGILNGSQRNGRTDDQIFNHWKQGKIAEMFLVKHFRYKKNVKRYHDIISHDGIETEVKAFSYYTEDIIKKTISKMKGWNDSKRLVLFLYNRGTYTFYRQITI